MDSKMSFKINNKLIFVDSFQFLSSSLDSLVKNLGSNDFKCLSQGFNSQVLYLVKQKGFYLYELMSDFEKFREEFSGNLKFYGSLMGKKISGNKYEHVLKVCDTFEMKRMKDYDDLFLKCDVLLLTDVSEKFRNAA